MRRNGSADQQQRARDTSEFDMAAKPSADDWIDLDIGNQRR